MYKMKTKKSNNLLQVLNTVAISFLIATGLLISTVSCKPKYTIVNPYESVNWKEDGRFKANLHTHTTRSDGSFSPQKVVDCYHDLGYDILALTDHNVLTYPWQKFSTFKVSNGTLKRIKEGKLDSLPREKVFVFEDRNPDTLGMIDIQAAEVTQHHHMGSYFNDHAGGVLKTVAESLDTITKKNGLAVLFHPGSYNSSNNPKRPFHPIEWYADIFKRYDHLVGIEAYNNGNQPFHINRWDSILIKTMPDRSVWGFSNDDFHGGEMGRNWNVFLLPELSSDEVRRGMENGLFYFVYSPGGLEVASPPIIKSITVNSKRGIIQIEATGCKFIEWKSDNKVVHRGGSFNLNDFPEVNGYIRAELYESENGAMAGTQPFGIRRR